MLHVLPILLVAALAPAPAPLAVSGAAPFPATPSGAQDEGAIEAPAPTLEERIEAIYALIEERRGGDAMQAAEALAGEFEDSARAVGLHAVLLLNTGQVGEGQAALERAQRIDAHVPEVVSVLVQRKAAVGDHAGAIELVRTALETHPNLPELYQLLGELLFATRAFDQAMQVFSDGLAHCTTVRQKLGLITRTSQAAGQVQNFEVIETAMTAAMTLGDDLRFLYTRAEARGSMEKFPEALEDAVALLAREDVQADANALGASRTLLDAIVAKHARATNPVEPYVWLMRLDPGNTRYQGRLARVMADLRQDDAEEPFGELIQYEEIVVEEPPLEPWQGEITDEDREYMAEQDMTEEEFRIEKAELDLMFESLAGPSQAWRAEARKRKIQIPKALAEARSEVDDEIYESIGSLTRSGGWMFVVPACEEWIAKYPSSRAFAERAWARMHLGDHEEALADLRCGIAVEFVERREDRMRAWSQGWGGDRMEQLLAHEATMVRLAAREPNEREAIAIEGIEAMLNEDLLTAFEKFSEAAPTGEYGGPYFETRARREFVQQYEKPLGDALTAKGEAALAAGDEETAFAVEEQLNSIFITHAPSDVFKGRCALARGRADKAATCFGSALHDDPLSPGGHLELGRIAEAAGDANRALAHYSTGAGPVAIANDTTGDQRQCVLERARLEDATGDGTAVYKAYAAVANATLKERGRADEAVCFGALSRLLELGGNAIELKSFRKWRSLRLDLPQWTVEDCEWLLEQEGVDDDERVACYDLLASSYRKLDKDRAAAPLYREYAKLRPEESHPYEQLGFTLQDLGEVDEALAAFTKAIELGTDNPFVWMERAEMHALKEMWMEAADDASKASELGSEQDRTGLVLRASSSAVKWSEKAFQAALRALEELDFGD